MCLANGQKDATAQDLWLENLEIWLCLLLVFGLVLTLEFPTSAWPWSLKKLGTDGTPRAKEGRMTWFSGALVGKFQQPQACWGVRQGQRVRLA